LTNEVGNAKETDQKKSRKEKKRKESKKVKPIFSGTVVSPQSANDR